MKSELQTIIDGLQHYLRDVEGKADTQRQECDKLLREREELLQHMDGLERERVEMKKKTKEMGQLREVKNVFWYSGQGI